MTDLLFLQNTAVALALGCLIGLERQITGHSIGIRTGMLVCIGASIFTSFAYCVPNGDITRMAAQVISGVGFLGSGIIFKDGANIRDINTAATIWCTAGVGVLVGAGLYGYAAITAASLIVVNLALRFLSRWTVLWQVTSDDGGFFELEAACAAEQEAAVREKLTALLSRKKNCLLSMDCKKLPGQRVQLVTKFVYSGRDYAQNNETIVKELLDAGMADSVKWKVDE